MENVTFQGWRLWIWVFCSFQAFHRRPTGPWLKLANRYRVVRYGLERDPARDRYHLQSMQWNIKWYRSTDHSCLSMSVVICWRFSVRFGLGVPRAERCGLPWSVPPRNPEETQKGPFGPSMVPSRVTSFYLILFVHPHDAKVVHLKLAHIPTGCHCILGMTKKYM